MASDFSEFSRLLEAGIKDCGTAPEVSCPSCGRNMIKEIGLIKISGYRCMSFGCPNNGRKISIEQLSDAAEYRLWQDEARIRKEQFEAMRERNGAHERRGQDQFEKIRQEFCVQNNISPDQLHKELVADRKSPLAKSWREFLARDMESYCADCKGYHKPTAEHPSCFYCGPGFVHSRLPEDTGFEYRGWRFTAPFICMSCGIKICYRQWGFSRTCGACDVGSSKTARLFGRKCFSGPHVKLSTWSAKEDDIEEREFVSPDEREKYPVLHKQARHVITCWE